jgi:hypothetical protein
VIEPSRRDARLLLQVVKALENPSQITAEIAERLKELEDD